MGAWIAEDRGVDQRVGVEVLHKRGTSVPGVSVDCLSFNGKRLVSFAEPMLASGAADSFPLLTLAPA